MFRSHYFQIMPIGLLRWRQTIAAAYIVRSRWCVVVQIGLLEIHVEVAVPPPFIGTCKPPDMFVYGRWNLSVLEPD